MRCVSGGKYLIYEDFIMFVILEADGRVYRLYDTIGQCWRCDLIRPRREHLTYNEFRSALSRGETIACLSFFVRKCNGEEDIENYKRTKAEWDATVGATLKARSDNSKGD